MKKQFLPVFCLFFFIAFASAAHAACTVPTNAMSVTTNTTFCTGTYALDSGITIGADSLTLDCNGSTLIGKRNSSSKGIFMDTRTNVVVENCIVSNYSYNIRIEDSDDNNFTNCNTSLGDWNGFYLTGSDSNRIVDCNVSGNDLEGVYIYGESNSNKIINSTVSYNWIGVHVLTYNPLNRPDYNTINRSELNYNSNSGILTNTAWYTRVVNSTLNNNSFHGANLWAGGGETIMYNNITLNGREGIYVRFISIAATIRYNNIHGNNVSGGYYEFTSEDGVNAPYNYWGTANCDAVNDSIYDWHDNSSYGNVTYDPILDATYPGGSSKSCLNYPPSFWILAPDNRTITNDNTTGHIFLINDPDNTSAACTLYYNNTNVSYNGSVNNWTSTTLTPSAQIDGNWTWHLNCNDGTNSVNSSMYWLYIDQQAPAISYNADTDANGTYDRNWTFINVTVSDISIDTVLLEWNGVNESFDNNDGTNWWENKTGLTGGSYTFRAIANDSAGNDNSTTFRQINFDVSGPNITFTSPTPSNETKNQGWILVNVTVFDNFSNISSCTLDWNGSNSSMTLSGSGNNVTCYKNTTNLLDGNYTFKVYANDTSSIGNVTHSRWVYINYLGPTTPPQNLSAEMNANNQSVDLSWSPVSGAQWYLIYYTYNASNLLNESLMRGEKVANRSGQFNTSWTDAGDSAYISWYYRVVAVGTSNATSVSVVGRFRVPVLQANLSGAKMNLVSLPITPTNSSISNIIRAAPSNLTTISYFSANATIPRYISAVYKAGAWNGPLTQLQPGKSYVVTNTQGFNFTFAGTVPNETVQVVVNATNSTPGRIEVNTLGWTSSVITYDLNSTLNATGMAAGDTVSYYNASSLAFETITRDANGWTGDFNCLQPGKGYFFTAQNNYTWSYNST